MAARGATGAGDAFVAAHLAARADGLDPEAALAAALAAAARHVAAPDGPGASQPPSGRSPPSFSSSGPGGS